LAGKATTFKVDFLMLLIDGLGMHPLFSAARAFLFDFDGTLARLNIDFLALRKEIILMARGLGLTRLPPQEPPYLLELTRALREQLAALDPGRGELFYGRAMELIEERERAGAGPENLFPYTPVVLKKIRELKWKMAVLTRNSGRSVYLVFPELDNHVDLFLPREKVVRPKPDPAHLLQAVEALQVPPQDAIMVGDHPIDIVSGKKAGTRTIAVLTGRTKEGEMKEAAPDLILPSLESLLALIQ
jgi:phosphoglycolate phosphatase